MVPSLNCGTTFAVNDLDMNETTSGIPAYSCNRLTTALTTAPPKLDKDGISPPGSAVAPLTPACANSGTSAGVTLGKTYPQPLVAHAKGRERGLAAYAKIRKG